MRFKIAQMVVRTRFRELCGAEKEITELCVQRPPSMVAVASNIEGAYRVSVMHAEPIERDNTERVKVNYKMLIFLITMWQFVWKSRWHKK